MRDIRGRFLVTDCIPSSAADCQFSAVDGRVSLPAQHFKSVESVKSAMRPRISLLSRFLLIAIALCMAPAHQLPRMSPGEAPSARLMMEVRLRKLHLVRPDLIPYPIETEIYC